MRTPLLLLAAALLISACAPKVPVAESVLLPTKGNKTAGAMTFTQKGPNLLIQGDFTELTPGAHGFHIHDKGDCSAPDGTSAGGHFNPAGVKHGSPANPEHHMGDLPMLTAGADGKAHFEALMSGPTLMEGPGNIVSRAVVIHANPDDFTSQPAGNSGPRVACGVIRMRQ